MEIGFLHPIKINIIFAYYAPQNIYYNAFNGEIFYTLKEAKTLIEKWRMEYNTFRPHSSLNCRPPAPEAHLN